MLRLAVILTLLYFALIGSPRVYGQSPDIILVKRELSLGVGIAPVMPSGNLRGMVYSLDFNRIISDFFVAGVSAGLSGNRVWVWDKEDKESRFVSAMGIIRANFLSERLYKLYVSLGVGGMYGTFRKDDSPDYYKGFNFAWHGAAGFEFGDLYVFFIEAGIGSRGLASLGFRVRF